MPSFQMINRICSAFHISSDINSSTILYSEIDGSISTYSKGTGVSNIQSCAAKKHVKFYPVDNYVITSTDATGLSVFDRERSKLIYKYENENLYTHSYSDNDLIATFDDYNLKFYDLRCRYLSSSKPFANNKKIDWLGSFLYCKDNESLQIFDFRDLDSPIYNFKNVLDFAISDIYCYMLQLSEEEGCQDKFLVQTNPKNSKMLYLRKKVSYDKIFNLKNHNYIVGIANNKINFEDNDTIFSVSSNQSNIAGVYFCDANVFLFVNNSFYEVDSSFENFVKSEIINF